MLFLRYANAVGHCALHDLVSCRAGSPENPLSMDPSQLASIGAPHRLAAKQHSHKSSGDAVLRRPAGAPEDDEVISSKPKAHTPPGRCVTAADRGVPQLLSLPLPAVAAQKEKADILVGLGLATPHGNREQPKHASDAPLRAAGPTVQATLVQPTAPAVPLDGTGIAAPAVKAKDERLSPAWKVRAAKTAAQPTGNTLFAEICQPGESPVGTLEA